MIHSVACEEKNRTLDGSLIPSSGKTWERVHGWTEQQTYSKTLKDGASHHQDDVTFLVGNHYIHVHLIFGNVTGWWEDPKFTLHRWDPYPSSTCRRQRWSMSCTEAAAKNNKEKRLTKVAADAFETVQSWRILCPALRVVKDMRHQGTKQDLNDSNIASFFKGSSWRAVGSWFKCCFGMRLAPDQE